MKRASAGRSWPKLFNDASELGTIEPPRGFIKVERTFEIEPQTLILAASTEVPLLIAFGTPGAAEVRQRDRYLVGLLGACLAIVAAMIFAIMLSGGFGT